MAPAKRKFEEMQVEVSSIDFRKKFGCLFELDPKLSEDQIYETLAAVNFSVDKARVEIRNGIGQQRMKKFFLPASIMYDDETQAAKPLPSSQKTTDRWDITADDSNEDSELFERSSLSKIPRKLVSRPRMKAAKSSQNSFTKDSDGENYGRRDERSDVTDSDYYGIGDDQSEGTNSDYDSQATDDVENWAGKLYSKEDQLRYSNATPRLRGNPNNAVLKHRETTKLTPWTFRMAQPFYNNKIGEIENENLSATRNMPLMNADSLLAQILAKAQYPDRENSLRKLQLNSSSVWEDKNRISGYSSASVDGINYFTGEFVVLFSALASSKISKSILDGKIQSSSAGEISVAKVEYFFADTDNNDKIMVHLRWFEFGSKTILGEFASPNELFSLIECQDVPASHIAGKIHVGFLDAGRETKKFDLGEVRHPKDQLFYRFNYDPDTKQFTDVSLHVDIKKHHCYCCKVVEDIERESEVRIFGKFPQKSPRQHSSGVKYKTISYKTIDYHVHDFVYVFDSPKTPYTVAQIVNIETQDPLRSIRTNSVIKSKDLKINVDLYERYDGIHPTLSREVLNGKHQVVRDERHLYRTGQSLKIDVHSLDGKCYVKLRSDISDLDALKDRKDTFWVEEEVKCGVNPYKIQRFDLLRIKPGSLQYSSQTEAEVTRNEERLEDFLKNGSKMRGMEIFCGAGGLSFGLAEGLFGAVEFVSAVEFSEAACRTYSANHPGCQVSNGDASILLERAIRHEKGEILSPLVDCHGRAIPDLPRPREIDFICGGPPCPGFSGLNRNKKVDDIKNSLVILYLAYLDFYKPKYFLIENVAQILTEPLVSVQGSETTMIEQGTLKFILRFAVSFGYQIQFALLQAAEHGTPQSRMRAFIWGSQSGYRLPPYPQPDNVMNARAKVKITARKTNGWQRIRRAAPHYIVTVGDAISDLPAFEWVNPCGYTASEKEERQLRSDTIKQHKIEKGSKYTGENLQAYASPPLSEFQRRSRRLVQYDQLTCHVTEPVSEKIAWKVCKVPLTPGADHRDIQGRFPGETSQSQKGKSDLQPGRYGRLDVENMFKASHTKLDPGLVPGMLLNPTQYRIISIRENARAMGFSDGFIFDLEDCETSTIKDVIRQEGNAVPPTFARAIGNEWLWVLVDDYHEKKAARQLMMKATDVRQKAQSGKSDYPIIVDDDGFVDIDDI